MWWFVLLAMIIAIMYYYINQKMNYWKKRNIAYEKSLPFIGNMLQSIMGTCSTTDFFSNIYKKYQNKRYVGIFDIKGPALLIKDPELIKLVLVKEFDTFFEHKPLVPQHIDSFWCNNIFAITGTEEWRQLRTTLSSLFTGYKMRNMFLVMNEYSKLFSKNFIQHFDLAEVELKDLFSRFANDAVLATSFGIRCDSISEPNNDFYVKGCHLCYLVNTFQPIFTQYFKFPIITKKLGRFFKTYITKTIRSRRESGATQTDMLHFLIAAQEKKIGNEEVCAKPKFQLTDDMITAQFILFIFAGFDTMSTFMALAFYELALNLDVQKKLYTEVRETLTESKGEITYDNLKAMKYLDMVVSETLRKWPPFVSTDRLAMKPFKIEPKKPGEQVLLIEKGVTIVIPIMCLHRDPTNYPNPEKFDPERFNDQQKIKPYTYLPFGAGPRNCIASRMALLEGKLIIAEIISKCEVLPIKKTKVPLPTGKCNFSKLPEEGVWVGFKLRK
ncbi:hypothetical protein FQA39_LY15385 [Lamprigera yunnana]|nr:hypothetical protein FQA39_LY15385 [Lamprigera yunnana]